MGNVSVCHKGLKQSEDGIGSISRGAHSAARFDTCGNLVEVHPPLRGAEQHQSLGQVSRALHEHLPSLRLYGVAPHGAPCAVRGDFCKQESLPMPAEDTFLEMLGTRLWQLSVDRTAVRWSGQVKRLVQECNLQWLAAHG